MNNMIGAINRSIIGSAARSRLQTRFGHSLIVPYAHIPCTKFENGVPVKQVRELTENEKAWEFWSTSPAFYEIKPSAIFVAHVPKGELWVVERAGSFSRVLPAGAHFFLPLVDKVFAVKSPHTVVSGVMASNVSTKNKANVDVYAVVYFKVTDARKSAYYINPETNKKDSERTLVSITRHILASEVAKLELTGDLTAAHKSTLTQNILSALEQQQSKLGITVSEIEIRGVFEADSKVRDKLRALDPPAPDYSTPGHDLAPDYWAEHLTPPYFEKKVYGSAKQPHTPAAVSLEWSIPSPPDFHHFHQVPRLVVAPSEEKTVAKSH